MEKVTSERSARGGLKSCAVAALAAVAVLLAGCAGKDPARSALDIDYQKWKAMAETNRAVSQARPAAPPAVEALAAAKLEIEPAPPPRPLPNQDVSLRMNRASVPSVLRALARAADQNIMLSDTVDGHISINVEGTPWDQVFRGIIATQGLAWHWEDDIIRVITVTDKEKEFLQLEADLRMQTTRRDLKTLERLVTRIVPLRYYNFSRRQITGTGGATAGRTIEERLEDDIYESFKENLGMLLSRDREGNPIGSIVIDEQTNMVLIHALPEDVDRVLAMIAELDGAPPQILIEAHIVETSRETARELGIQWGGLYRAGNYYITPGAGTTGVLGRTLSEGVDPTTGIAARFPADFGLGQDPAGLTLGYVYEKLGKYILDVELSALESDGKLNILSRPSITTLNNQAAVIESGAEVPYQTITGTGATRDVSIEFKTAVLRLEVTPRVIEDRTVRLNIVTTKDELDFTRTVLGNPTIITKRAETNVILESGETTVIGGLSKETDQASRDGIPGLRDIPGLGYLFGRKGTARKMEDVLIFITPQILDDQRSRSGPPLPPPDRRMPDIQEVPPESPGDDPEG